MVETAGKVHQNPGGVRVYFKPAIGKAVWRKSGVNRQSAAVIRRNEAFASDDRSRRMPCHCWRSSVERLHCRAQVMRKKQEPWHWSKQVKRIPHEVQQVPQGTEGRCCSNSSLREKLLKLFNLVIEKARAPSPSFF